MYDNIGSLREEKLSEFTALSKTEVITGIVTESKASGLLISINDEIVEASKAFSCLVVPQVSDLVSVVMGDNMYYVTNVLHRLSPDMRIECAGNIDFKMKSMNVYAVSINSYIDTIKNFFNSLELSGFTMNIKTAILKTFSKTNENNHVEVTNRYDRSFTYIKDMEELQAKSSRHLIEGNKVVKASNILTTAKNQVKIDGKNISLA